MNTSADRKREAEQLAYRESERLIDTQLRSIDELRGRTGLLLAALAVTASFLGAAALDREGDLEGWAIAALVVFAVGVVACLFVLWPKRDAYKFVISPKVLLEDWADTDRPDQSVERFVAEYRETHYEENKPNLDRLFVAFRVAAIAVGVEVALWSLELVT